METHLENMDLELPYWKMSKVSMHDITYSSNTKGVTDIYDHLMKCDTVFIAGLKARTTIKEYAEKIVTAAVRFEAVLGSELIGLVACYFNNKVTNEGYITNVSLVKGYTGKGIASRLMQNTIQYADDNKFNKIKLEVETGNHAAIALYRKWKFVEVEEKAGVFILEKKLT
jgi:ribosomal protein S18 acetylase RimI-like enzyme